MSVILRGSRPFRVRNLLTAMFRPILRKMKNMRALLISTAQSLQFVLWALTLIKPLNIITELITPTISTVLSLLRVVTRRQIMNVLSPVVVLQPPSSSRLAKPLRLSVMVRKLHILLNITPSLLLVSFRLPIGFPMSEALQLQVVVS